MWRVAEGSPGPAFLRAAQVLVLDEPTIAWMRKPKPRSLGSFGDWLRGGRRSWLATGPLPCGWPTAFTCWKPAG